MYEEVQIRHLTHYYYDRLTTLGPQSIRLNPSKYHPIEINNFSISINPKPSSLEWFNDIYDNSIASAIFDTSTTELHIEVSLTARLRPLNIINFELPLIYQKYPFFYPSNERKEILTFLGNPEPTLLFEEFVNNIDTFNKSTIELIAEINKIVHRHLTYIRRKEPGIYSPEETLNLRSGSCRDFAWLLVNIFRKLGIASRFVSGYSIISNEVDLHAWCEVYLPNKGWIGLDATNGLFCTQFYIPLAAAPYPSATAPIEGLISSCHSEFNVEMYVERIL